jgi:RNA polymerase primary sigma factor
MRKLVRAARRGDRGARARLVEHHLGLVRTVAAKYRDYGLPFDDLVQEGSIGLLDAIDHFDPDRGVDFESYARFRVRRAIRNALTDQVRLIRLPRRVVEHRRALDRAESRLVLAGKRPTPAELASVTGLPLSAVLEARAVQAPISLDAPVLPDGTPLESLVADPSASDPAVEALAHEEEALLRAALARLAPRERKLVGARCGIGGARPASAAELSRELGLSPRRAQVLGHDAVARLRQELVPSN